MNPEGHELIFSDNLEVGQILPVGASFAGARPPMIKLICPGWEGRQCGRLLGWMVGAGPKDEGMVSHGCCRECSAAVIASIPGL